MWVSPPPRSIQLTSSRGVKNPVLWREVCPFQFRFMRPLQDLLVFSLWLREALSWLTSGVQPRVSGLFYYVSSCRSRTRESGKKKSTGCSVLTRHLMVMMALESFFFLSCCAERISDFKMCRRETKLTFVRSHSPYSKDNKIKTNCSNQLGLM